MLLWQCREMSKGSILQKLNHHTTRDQQPAGLLFLLGSDSMAKQFARKFYSSKAWQSCRNEYGAKVHWLCENCLRKGIYKPGVIVHHIIEIDPVTIEKPEISLNHNNLELLCRECHAEAHDQHGGRWAVVNERKKLQREKNNRYVVDENGNVSPNAPLCRENYG